MLKTVDPSDTLQVAVLDTLYELERGEARRNQALAEALNSRELKTVKSIEAFEERVYELERYKKVLIQCYFKEQQGNKVKEAEEALKLLPHDRDAQFRVKSAVYNMELLTLTDEP